MPTIFSHAFFAVVLGKAAVKKSVIFWFWFLTAVCAMIPDADVFFRALGAERGSMFSHRGFTHSIAFALLSGSFAALLARKFMNSEIPYAKLLLFFALATVSHPLLDMLTDGGSGVALFAPFSDERFFFPYRPIEVSPIGLGFFSDRGLTVIFSELVWVWFSAILFLILVKLGRKYRQ